jgi:hypothetical protein
MKILNTIRAAIAPHILCVSLLALLTGCGVTVDIKPDKAPGAFAGHRQTPPPWGPMNSFNPGVYNPGVYNPGVYNPGPFAPTYGVYGQGAQPVSHPMY